jgi:hypothetical protein
MSAIDLRQNFVILLLDCNTGEADFPMAQGKTGVSHQRDALSGDCKTIWRAGLLLAGSDSANSW